MALGQHRWDRIPFGGKIEQQEKVVVLVDGPGPFVRDIDIGHLIFLRIGRDGKVGESEAVVVIETFRVTGNDGISVEHIVADIQAVGSQGNIKAVGRGAHGKHISAAGNELADLFGHRQFQLGHLGESPAGGSGFLCLHILLVPRIIAVARPELAILSREILMMQVEPIV